MPTGRLCLSLTAVGAAAGLHAIALAIWEPSALTLPAAVHVAIGWSFLAAGVVACERRPENRTGLLMMLTGVVWFGRDLDSWGGAIVTHLSDLSLNAFVALVAHQVIVFPDGVARSRLERVLVGTVYALALGGYLLSELVGAANDLLAGAAIVVLVAIIFVVVERWGGDRAGAACARAPALGRAAGARCRRPLGRARLSRSLAVAGG